MVLSKVIVPPLALISPPKSGVVPCLSTTLKPPSFSPGVKEIPFSVKEMPEVAVSVAVIVKTWLPRVKLKLVSFARVMALS